MRNKLNTTISKNSLTRKNKIRLKRLVRVKDILLIIVLLAMVISMTVIFVDTPFDEDAPKREIAEYYLKNNAEKTGSANVVTSVIVNFRGFDTLGEVTVLFLAASGVGAVLFLGKSGHTTIRRLTANAILRTGSRVLFPILVLYGIYIIVHGHLSPGGGFQGGVVIATAFLLLFLGDNNYNVKEGKVVVLESLSGSAFVIIGLIGLTLAVTSTFLGNFLPHSSAELGRVFSAGIIPLIYVFVGIKVGSELTGLIQTILE